MAEEGGASTSGAVTFTGSRLGLFGVLFRGYLLMVPTIGLYRFWLTTFKRRYYWMNTVIDGDPLEYTGDPLQLLIGFLLALSIFLPIYVAFFYLSIQPIGVAVLGYVAIVTGFWFLTGYATYRGRDFRLSRTLWRGVRFDQKGSAINYAIRRFLWSLLVLLTLGLAYPFMAGNLWRYRYTNSWYGDRQFGFTGSWKTIAGPYYGIYFLVVLILFFAIGIIGSGGLIPEGDMAIPRGSTVLAGMAGIVVAAFGYAWYRAREASKMLSCVRIGEASAEVRVGTWRMFLQFVLYILGLAGSLLVLILFGGLIINGVIGQPAAAADVLDAAQGMQRGWIGILVVLFGYLAIISAFVLMGEVFLGYGYWMLVARGARISNVESLRTVNAAGEDRALMGEGLADALNVEAY